MISLPEAIRKGSTYQPQGFGTYARPASDGQGPWHTCALGAAVAGVLGHPIEGEDIPDVLQNFFLQQMNCNIWHQVDWEDLPPEVQQMTQSSSKSLDDVLVLLNDTFFWEREKIADWAEEYLQRKGLLS